MAISVGSWNYLGRETVDASASAASPASMPTNARFAVIAPDTAGARFTQDGSTAASATVGLPLGQYEKFLVNCPADLTDLSMYGAKFEVVYYSA